MSDDNCDASVEREDGTIILYLRNRQDAIFHPWRYEAFAEMTPEEARDLAAALEREAAYAEAVAELERDYA